MALLGGRQLGKDRTMGLYVAHSLVYTPGTSWTCISASEEHAKDLLREIKRFVKLFLTWAPNTRVTENNVQTLSLSNGSRAVSRAAVANAVQGARQNVLLNELGIMPNAESIYDTAYPVVRGQLEQGRDARMILMGNASERGSFWHRFWTSIRPESFTYVTTTWLDAQTEWYRSRGIDPEAIEASRAAIIRDIGRAGYEQWYACMWRANAESWITHETLDAATYDTTPIDGPTWVGYDVARHAHLAATARVVEVGGLWYVLPVSTMRGVGFAAQRRNVAALAVNARGIVMDSTGMGLPQYEALCAETPTRVHGVTFGPNTRMDLFTTLREGLQSRRVLIPRSDDNLRVELEGIETRYSQGSTRIHLPEGANGHSDRAVAVALAVYGAMGRINGNGPSQAWLNLYGVE